MKFQDVEAPFLWKCGKVTRVGLTEMEALLVKVDGIEHEVARARLRNFGNVKVTPEPLSHLYRVF